MLYLPAIIKQLNKNLPCLSVIKNHDKTWFTMKEKHCQIWWVLKDNLFSNLVIAVFVKCIYISSNGKIHPMHVVQMRLCVYYAVILYYLSCVMCPEEHFSLPGRTDHILLSRTVHWLWRIAPSPRRTFHLLRRTFYLPKRTGHLLRTTISLTRTINFFQADCSFSQKYFSFAQTGYLFSKEDCPFARVL